MTNIKNSACDEVLQIIEDVESADRKMEAFLAEYKNTTMGKEIKRLKFSAEILLIELHRLQASGSEEE